MQNIEKPEPIVINQQWKDELETEIRVMLENASLERELHGERALFNPKTLRPITRNTEEPL